MRKSNPLLLILILGFALSGCKKSAPIEKRYEILGMNEAQLRKLILKQDIPMTLSSDGGKPINPISTIQTRTK